MVPESPLLRLDRLSAGFEATVVFRTLSFDVPRTGVVALMGPAGVGKSTLLRTLGRWNAPHPAFWCHGHVWLDGVDLLRDLELSDARRRVAMLAQKARLFTATILDNAIALVAEGRVLTFGQKRALAEGVLAPWGLWDELRDDLDAPVTRLSIARQRMLTLARLVSGGATCVLADEPFRDTATEDRPRMLEMLQRLRRRIAVVMVTHDQRIAAELADLVCLVSAGRLVEATPAQSFFREPRTALGREFLRSGNCWPGASDDGPGADAGSPAETSERPSWAPTPEEAVARPGGFHWIIPGLLGGMQSPGLLNDEATDLNALAGLGIRHLVSLTEEPFDAAKLLRVAIHSIHFPIPDMGVPELDDARALCHRISSWLDRGEPVVIHCKAGLGRTGTILACALIWRGLDPLRSIHEVRQVNPRYIQSAAQIAFVERFRAGAGSAS